MPPPSAALRAGADSVDAGRQERPVLIRTWVDGASLPDASGRGFHDRYFPGVAEWLTEHGLRAITVPALQDPPGGERAAWAALRATGREFLSAGRRYRASDYAFALREHARAATMRLGRVDVGGLDVTGLFAAERVRAAFDSDTMLAALWERLPLRLAAEGIRPLAVFDMFENLAYEKPFTRGMRRHLPGVPVVGYQHSTLSPNLLANFVPASEAPFAPLPDAVVCDGRLSKGLLAAEGLPERLLHEGPALRFGHLFRGGPASREPEPERDEVLVPLPLVRDAAAELLLKVVRALEGDPARPVKVKPHPMGPVEPILVAAGVDALPGHFEVVGGGMGEWIDRAGVVVSLGSSALYESLAAGVEVIVVGRDAALDLNPLAWHPDLARLVHGPEAIADAVRAAFARTPAERAALRERATEVLRETFNPIDDSGLGAFWRAAGYESEPAPTNSRTASTT